jgi:hypothetical protein
MTPPKTKAVGLSTNHSHAVGARSQRGDSPTSPPVPEWEKIAKEVELAEVFHSLEEAMNYRAFNPDKFLETTERIIKLEDKIQSLLSFQREQLIKEVEEWGKKNRESVSSIHPSTRWHLAISYSHLLAKLNEMRSEIKKSLLQEKIK